MAIARSLAGYRQARGNLALLVLADSSQAEFGFLFETTFAALSHFGMPMRVLDLAKTRLDLRQLSTCSAVLISQEHLGASLGRGQVAMILKAVSEGLGFVNLDSDLSLYGPELAAAVGLKGAGRGGELVASGTQDVNVVTNDHEITWMQDGTLHKRLKVPVPTMLTKLVAKDTETLLVDENGGPMLVARRLGEGKIVQAMMSPRMWLSQYFGHTFGLDDVWRRSIIWAARKPFVMKGMPPFVRLRFDDCQGLWREASDLRFLDILNEYGHVPSLCFCVRAIQRTGAQKLRDLYEKGKLEIIPHTIAPMTSLYYGSSDREYSQEELRTLIGEADSFLSRWGIRQPRILSDHDHAWSPNAIPDLEARGTTYKMNITVPGEPWDAVHRDWHPAPYGSMDYAFDFLPAPASRFFAVYNHFPPAFQYARAYLDEDHFVYHRAGGYGPYKWDFLNGLTKGSVYSTNQIAMMAERLADHTRLGLDAMFFGGSISHSHFTQHLSPSEWHELLQAADRRMPRHRYELVGYETIAEYARSKVQTCVTGARLDGTRVRIDLVGDATVPLRIQVYNNVEIDDQHCEEVEAFSGTAHVTFPM